jgi:hypothetical protein
VAAALTVRRRPRLLVADLGYCDSACGS